MSVYLVSLLLGGVGFSVMAVSGAVRHSGGARAGRHGRGHVRGAAKGHARGHSHGRAAAARGGRGAAGRAIGHLALALTSPRFVFSMGMGAGLTGLVAGPFLPEWLLPFAAIAGGFAFERVFVGPIWDFLMRFASEPALTLEHCPGDDATVVTSFDSRGHGIVSVELDGQVVQLLATLQPNLGRRVTAGTRVRIEDVDVARNRCTVSLH